MTEPRLKMSPPWVIYVRKLEAIFDEDPQIAFNIDWEDFSVTLATNNGEKAAALEKLLPETKTFGNVDLSIEIECPNKANLAFATAADLFNTAFEKNPVFEGVIVPEGVWFVPITYVMFKNVVVQFFADNLNDPRGLISTLYQEIASEIFADMPYLTGGIITYCTDVEKNLGKPLGEWP